MKVSYTPYFLIVPFYANEAFFQRKHECTFIRNSENCSVCIFTALKNCNEHQNIWMLYLKRLLHYYLGHSWFLLNVTIIEKQYTQDLFLTNMFLTGDPQRLTEKCVHKVSMIGTSRMLNCVIKGFFETTVESWQSSRKLRTSNIALNAISKHNLMDF